MTAGSVTEKSRGESSQVKREPSDVEQMRAQPFDGYVLCEVIDLLENNN
jgi:hypothetical protein